MTAQAGRWTWRARHGVRLAAAAITMHLAVTVQAAAQAPLVVTGRVVRQAGDAERAVRATTVTLHRVSAREAGPIDSVATDPAGRYAFRVAAPDTQAMYLASARHGGIAYFSSPIDGGGTSTPGEIVVFDTTSRDIPLHLQGRHLIVSAPDPDGVRSVIDVFEIENDTAVTRVPGAENRPTFTVALASGARNARASQGEVSDGALEVRDGRAEVFAAFSPGMRQLVITYELEAAAFPVQVPIETPVGVLEVLLEEPGAAASGAGVVSRGPVTVEGKTFTRFLAQDAASGAMLTVLAGSGSGGGGVPAWLVPVVLSLLALGGVLAWARRSPARAPATPPPLPAVGPDAATSADGVARHVAAIDALLERSAGWTAAQRDTLAGYRTAVRDRLVATLAERGGDR